MKITTVIPFCEINTQQNINKPNQNCPKTFCKNNYTFWAQKTSLTSDIVSFGACKKINKSKQVTDLRNIPNITCACCGIETIQNAEIDSFMQKEIYYPADKALTILKKAGYFKKKTMSKAEKDAYNFCRLYATLYEGECINNIFDKEFIQSTIIALPTRTREEVRKIENMIKKIYHNSEYMLKAIEPFYPRLHPMQKEVVDILKQESKKAPEKNFSEILSNPQIREKNLKCLEEKQEKIFREVEQIANKMSPESKKAVLQNIQTAKTVFNVPVSLINKKRTYVIELFKELENNVVEKSLMQQILNKVYSLPSSINDANSFIIKYSERNPNEILDAILRASSGTIEHVKPKKRQYDNGENNISNYIILCKKCNSERERIPYYEFMKFHQDMFQNLQKYLNIVIENINNGILVGYDSYPLKIRDAVEKESDEQNLLDYSKLNIFKAIENRRKIAKNK